MGSPSLKEDFLFLLRNCFPCVYSDKIKIGSNDFPINEVGFLMFPIHLVQILSFLSLKKFLESSMNEIVSNELPFEEKGFLHSSNQFRLLFMDRHATSMQVELTEFFSGEPMNKTLSVKVELTWKIELWVSYQLKSSFFTF